MNQQDKNRITALSTLIQNKLEEHKRFLAELDKLYPSTAKKKENK